MGTSKSRILNQNIKHSWDESHYETGLDVLLCQFKQSIFETFTLFLVLCFHRVYQRVKQFYMSCNIAGICIVQLLTIVVLSYICIPDSLKLCTAF